jgi:deazaflavin-dependent oxidoreductase (nitroreductase family)
MTAGARIARAYTNFLEWLTGHRAGAWLGAHVFSELDRWLWLRFRRNTATGNFPELLLTTRGRRSGEPRSVPVLYLQDDGRIVLVASNWGQQHHPAWSENLMTTPSASICLNGIERPVRARLANDAEKNAYWPRLLKIHPAWANTGGGATGNSGSSFWSSRNARRSRPPACRRRPCCGRPGRPELDRPPSRSPAPSLDRAPRP